MFDPSIPQATGTKGTVPMASFISGKKVDQARPKGRIVGKDQPRQPYRNLYLLPDGRVLTGYRGRYIDSPFGLQVRAGRDWAVQAELPGAAGPFSLREGKLLASGPLFGGYQASLRVVDLAALSILDTFPLCQPFLWLAGPEARFVGQTPSFPSFASRPHVDPTHLDRHPSLRRWIEDERRRRLLLVGPDGEVQRSLDADEVGPEYPVFRELALSADGTVLYAATERSVAAVDLTGWSLRWRTQLGDNDGGKFLAIYAMALSGDGSRLAVGGLAGYDNAENTLAVLDVREGKVTAMGKVVAQAIGNTSIRSLAWHPAGWLAAGTASGLVFHVDPGGGLRRYKGAGKSVEALVFVDAGRSLLICGNEAQFRVWPLLEDEVGGDRDGS